MARRAEKPKPQYAFEHNPTEGQELRSPEGARPIDQDVAGEAQEEQIL